MRKDTIRAIVEYEWGGSMTEEEILKILREKGLDDYKRITFDHGEKQ